MLLSPWVLDVSSSLMERTSGTCTIWSGNKCLLRAESFMEASKSRRSRLIFLEHSWVKALLRNTVPLCSSLTLGLQEDSEPCSRTTGIFPYVGWLCGHPHRDASEKGHGVCCGFELVFDLKVQTWQIQGKTNMVLLIECSWHSTSAVLFFFKLHIALMQYEQHIWLMWALDTPVYWYFSPRGLNEVAMCHVCHFF